MDRALELFNEMPQRELNRNVVTYTAMISGLSKYGRADEAFKLYDEMKAAGIEPDDRIYSSLTGSLHGAGS